MLSSKMHVRAAGLSPDDGQFIIEAFDSTLSYLAAVGSGEMWGNEPFSQREGFVEETLGQLEQSQEDPGSAPAGSDKAVLRILIAEVEVSPADERGPVGGRPRGRVAEDGTQFVSVGALMLRENWVPSYVETQAHLGLRTKEEDRGSFVYLEVVVTDYRAGDYRRGAGSALLEGAKEYAVARGKKSIYVDAWAGNGRKLVSYYEKQGFHIVGDFSLTRKSGAIWPGTLLRMNLG